MSTSPTPGCPRCGAALPADAPAGLCPGCLMALNLQDDTILSGGTPAAAPPMPPEAIAPHFPQLEILECLGRGGMGVVYQARQKSLNRLVALKLLAPERVSDPQFAERFAREAKALAALNHPNIVTVYDFGQAGGFYFFLMEYVDGVNLRRLLSSGRVAPREALAIVPQICDALQYAHDQGIIHRDIKPENILLDRRGRVKVADFGLAKIVSRDVPSVRPPYAPDEAAAAGPDESPPTHTVAGHVMGTPHYMAPEQVRHAGNVDHRADIYSLGVVFYQMLTGELPGRNLEPPSRKVTIDVRLDEVVLGALERNPEKRYRQASEVKTRVEAIVTTPPPSPGERAMEIKFHCPACQQKIAVAASAAGVRARCPSCGSELTVPSPVTPPSLVKPPSPAKPPAPPAPAPIPAPTAAPTPAPTPAPPARKPVRARRIAIASLVLGIIGLVPVLGLATGLLALALGIVALVKRTTRKGVAIAGTALGALATVMIPLHLAGLTAATTAARFGAGTAVCASNLKTIGVGLARYREQHGGSYPSQLNALVADGLIPARALSCPLHKGARTANDYDYAPPRGTPAQDLLVWDRYPHRVGTTTAGRNGLAADGSVRFVTEPQIQEIVRANQRAAAAATAAARGTPAGKPSSPMVTPPTRTAPTPPPPMTIASAIAALKSAPAREQHAPLRFLADESVETEQRDAVIAALKPLLNDMDNGEAAFQAFARWAGPDQVPDLIDFVTTAPQSSRGKESMKLLSRMGDARAAAPLAAQLSEFFVVRDAKAALAALGEIAKPAVLPLYHHEDRNAREAARELLRGYHATDAEILAESLRALGSESTGTRWSAVDYFNTMPIPADQREAVARALRPLVTITQDRLGNSARDAMKKVATQADADFLLELTASTDDATRRFATDLLVDFQDPRVAKPLAVLLSDANESYRAGDALIRLGSLAEPAILPHLRHPDPNTRKRAAEVLGKVGTASSLPALQIVAKDSNFFARVAAENALSAIRARPAPAVPQR